MAVAPEHAPVTPETPAAKTPGEDLRPKDVELRAAMVAYQAGTIDAFGLVYAALAPPLGRYLRFLTRRADLADDLLQEVFLQMHRSRATYTPEYPVSAWAFGVARNVYLMHRRAAARFSALHVDAGELPDLGVPAEMESLASRDLIRRALSQLDAGQCEPLVLHHVWGFSFEEIAGLMGITSATARARSSRAMGTLREHLRTLGERA